MNEITERILAPFVGCYIAGLTSGILIKIHYRIRPRGVPEESALTQSEHPKVLPVRLLHRLVQRPSPL